MICFGRALIWALAVALLAVVPAGAQHLRIYYPDIEQGSATLVVSPTGQALLVDAGTGLKVTEDGIENFINDLFDSGVVSSLDYVIATHYDEDHIGRMENVFQLVPMAPGAIAYDRGEVGTLPTSFAYSDYAFAAGFHNRTRITPFTTLDLGGGVTVRCYVENGELPNGMSVDLSTSAQQENAASVGVVVQYGDFEVWIGGDLTGNVDLGFADVESAVAPFVGDVDVYTFNHHGSRSSSNANFLSTLKAEVGINQNSVENGFGHPNSEVVTRFLTTPDSGGMAPFFYQQNPGDPGDTRSDDSLATAIADCDDVDSAFGLPGTMTLLSDGSSYRLHACGIAPTAFPADSGSGVIGDYPPAIRWSLRTPLVPTAVESVLVEAAIEDEGAVTASLHYELDGVVQAPIAMPLVSGMVYSASIPAQLDGTRVRFWVEATDSAGQIERSLARGYFSGVTPIATLRNDDASGVLIPKGYGARVQGNLTLEPGVIHDFVTQAYVQDASGGLQIFDAELLPLDRGDLVEFVGELEQFGGQTELNIAENFGNYGYSKISAGTPPAPALLTVATADETAEGTLVRLNGVSLVAGSIPESGTANLTLSDDGGATVMTLRIDGDTDIPGANTPTQPFDVIGVVSQFDSFVPLTSGFQILPRGRADLLTDEVNHPAVLIAEIHADPAGGPNGDANGDGSRSATADEFVELVNTSFAAVDLSGYTLADAIQVRHVFPMGTVVPPREAVVVFGGGTPSGAFGNAAANGLVFTASTGGLSLNNSGDSVILSDDLGGVVQTVAYGSEANGNQSIVRDPDWSNAPLVRHTDAAGSGNSRYSPGTRISGQAYTLTPGALLLTEVLYDPAGADGGLEWIEIYNASQAPIDLEDVCLGSGGSDYLTSLVPLSGTVAAESTFVVGGPTSSASNANPTFDQVFDFSPDLQNSGSTADGVALFGSRCSQVTVLSVPLDAVVYGGSNLNGLIDETGVANAPETGDAPSGSSVERIDLAGAWQIQANPSPNSFGPGSPPPPPPVGGDLLLSEVFYNASGSDDGLEWVEIYNAGTASVDLSSFSLGSGGSTYTTSKVQLSGTLAPGATFVVGGPTSSSLNGNPTFDLVVNFSPDFQNGGSTADGVALFDLPASQVTSSTVPVDAVVYGGSNSSGLIDESGVANAPEVGDAPAGSSVERIDLAGAWQVQASPTPGSSPL